MASKQSAKQDERNAKLSHGQPKLAPPPSQNTSRKHSAGRMVRASSNTKAATPGNSRTHSGQGRNRPTQMNNNNNTTSETSRMGKSGSAGRMKSNHGNTGPSRIMTNGSSRQRSADKTKRQGSGSSRQTPPKSKDNLSPDLQFDEDDVDLDDEQPVQFLDVTSNTNTTRYSENGGTIYPKTILEQCQEKQYNKVYEIDLHASKITKINNLEKFTCLRVLDLSSNHIRRIENLDANKEMKELKLYDNAITEISHLESTKELCTLQLQHNRIKQIGKGLSYLRKLSVLRLDSNKLSKIDSREMAPCGQLTYLDISSNSIDNLAPLNCLSSLEELHATHNQLKSIADLSRCRKLQEVDVSYNQVTDISGLKNLPHLTVLSVSNNLLNTSCLKAVGKLKCLQTLDISHNRLSDVDSIPMQFPSLEVLNITYNNISKWNTMCSLSKCENLSELFASGNPFCKDNGEKPNYHSELQTVIPSLEILDGANVKKSTAHSAPVMRPMSAASILSARQVENQLRTVERDLADFGANLAAIFESARTTVGSLPSEAPSPRPDSRPFGVPSSRPTSHLSIRSVSSVGDSRPVSRCSSRRRIADAKAFAATYS
ncbi:uncharacterized protein [Amphiura filiformis]|uniref:uncharacterized protein n=1 Tax=Amphiura filiformis TaxID=82378 RepID=UPI003B223DC7